jgi:hypothetical protein
MMPGALQRSMDPSTCLMQARETMLFVNQSGTTCAVMPPTRNIPDESCRLALLKRDIATIPQPWSI